MTAKHEGDQCCRAQHKHSTAESTSTTTAQDTASYLAAHEQHNIARLGRQVRDERQVDRGGLGRRDFEARLVARRDHDEPA